MFPDYMNDLLRHARCGHCDTPQTAADIQLIGVRRPEEFEAFYGEPLFVMTTTCKTCGRWASYAMRRSRTDAIAGVASFIDLVEKECEGKKPPINIPGLAKKTTSQSTTGLGAEELRPRPSIRLGQPNTPPTQREIQLFLQRLRKTSFKRDSKGFQSWMKGFGVDSQGIDEKS